jgi:hypothetical protein
MIEKTIHYIWLGSKEVPEKYASFIRGWAQLHPDWKIVKWNEESFDCESNSWVKTAIEQKNLPLAADVIRIYILLHHGGVYLDTDIELFKPLDRLVAENDFFIAWLIVSVVICFAYPWRDSLKICAVPVFMVIAAIAVLSLNKIPLGFISIAALILVFGLGLDYIVYMSGGEPRAVPSAEGSGKKNFKDKHITSFAVLLAFLTTLLSFGALVFSSFVPVHIFGLTVSAGISAAFISTMLLHGKKGITAN